MSETWNDPIVEEVRDIRSQLMKECDNDFDKLAERLAEIEKQHADKVVHRKPVPLKKSKTA